MAHNLFIAATDKDVGKSTLSFAVIHRLLEMEKKVGFMKPVGQRWLPTEWGEVEEDVILMKQAFNLSEHPALMNPVVIKRGFTEDYIFKTIKPDLSSKILECYDRVAFDKDYVIIEGTGHAGVGSVIDHSNAAVAALLDAKVILIAKGGIGNTIDRLELNRVFFESRGVHVIGVIINKVIDRKYDEVKDAIQRYCDEKKLKLFGVIRYSSVLDNPTLGTVIEELEPEVIQETGERNVVIDNYMIGASYLGEIVDYMKQKTGNLLFLFPSKRVDLIFGIPTMMRLKNFESTRIFSVLLTGQTRPDELSCETLRGENINVLYKEGDTFSIISKLSTISIKTRPTDSYKIDVIKRMVTKEIDFKRVLSMLMPAQVPDTPVTKLRRWIRWLINRIRRFFTKAKKTE